MSVRDEDEPFRQFVAGRYQSLVRTAYLLTGDRGHAEDLVQTALLRTYGAWRRLADPGNAEAYTRRVMVRLAARWRARRWHGERSADRLPEIAAGDEAAAVDLADAVRAALLSLPVRQRACSSCGSTSSGPRPRSRTSSVARSELSRAARVVAWPACVRRDCSPM